VGNPPPAMARSSRAQHLFDALQQSITVSEHDAVKLLPLLFIDFTCLECFQIEPDRRYRSFQLVCDGVDKRVVLLVAPYLANQERRVDDQTENQQVEQDDSQREQHDLRPVENDPANTQRHGERDEARAQRDEEGYRFTTTRLYAHGPRL